MDSPTPFPSLTRVLQAILAAAFFLSPAVSAEAAKSFKGPVEATVIEIIDGDTFLADVATPDGSAVSEIMLARDIVRPYRGGKRRSWCG